MLEESASTFLASGNNLIFAPPSELTCRLSPVSKFQCNNPGKDELDSSDLLSGKR